MLVKSINVTAVESKPVNPINKVGIDKVIIDKVAVPTTAMDTVGDRIMLCPIYSSDKILEVKVYNDALAASGLAYDIGLYWSGIGGSQVKDGRVSGTAISATCIGTAVAFSTARVVPGFVGFEARDIVNIDQEAWQIAGLTSDPGGIFYIGLTCQTVATTPAAGDIVMVVERL